MATGRNEKDGLEVQLAEALATIQRLRAENDRLRRLSGSEQSDSTAPRSARTRPEPPNGHVDAHSPQSAKVALFRGLFRGRDDVYAYRWVGREGKSGYSPALRPGARRLKGQRPNPEVLLPIDDEVVQSHLLGRRVVGVYPLLDDETCWFLAIDFDKSTWESDVAEMLRSCDELGIPDRKSVV